MELVSANFNGGSTVQQLGGERLHLIFNQVVLPADGLSVPFVSCSAPVAWRGALESELRTPFHLFAAPPVRAILLQADSSCLVVNVHHVASDMEAMLIMRSELAAHMSALSLGRMPPVLERLEFEYADFALWEHAREDETTSLSWWSLQLDGCPELISLPSDRARPDVQATAGNHVEVRLNRDLTARVMSLCMSAGATLNSALLAVWVALLLHLSGQADVVVGLPHSMRHMDELQRIVGMFINTLPLRCTQSEESVVGAVQVTQRAVGQALNHSHVPLYRIVGARRARRTTSHSALFQTMFQVNTFEGAALEEHVSSVDEPTVKVDLEMHLLHCAGEMGGILIYDAAIYDEISVQRWTKQYLGLLGHSVTEPAAPLQQLSLRVDIMADAERADVLWRFNDTFAAFPCGICVHDLVAAQANRTQSAVAVEWQGVHTTYAELLRSTEGVGARLRAQCAAPDRVVGVQLHRSLEQVVGVVGVLMSGGAYLPLDPKWPMERRQFMLEDAECEQLVGQSMHVGAFSWFVGVVLALDDARRMQAFDESAGSTSQPLTTRRLAYVMYTSGSTGKPKGVMVPHDGVVNLLTGACLRYWPVASTVFGVPTPYVFDVSVYNLLASFVVHCGTCRLLEDGSSLALLTAEDLVTRVAAVPSVLASILAVARLPPSVKHVEVGGEALTQGAISNLPSSTAVFNYYGPTEVAIWATRREVLRDEVVRRLASIGRPLPNVVCSIVSADDVRSQHLSPIGVWGELWLGGVQVARGYLKRQERTAESFVAFPWPATDPSGRGVVYRTGDRVRWYADGEVEFGGRIDFQVKLRGQRIELGEIEHALSSQPGVVEAIALLCTDLEEVSAEGQTRTHALMLTRHSAGLRFSPPPGGAGSLCLSSVRGRFAIERRIAIQPRAIAQWRT